MNKEKNKGESSISYKVTILAFIGILLFGSIVLSNKFAIIGLIFVIIFTILPRIIKVVLSYEYCLLIPLFGLYYIILFMIIKTLMITFENILFLVIPPFYVGSYVQYYRKFIL